MMPSSAFLKSRWSELDRVSYREVVRARPTMNSDFEEKQPS